MQQALERMNISSTTISDLTGVSGMKVIKAILAGGVSPNGCWNCVISKSKEVGQVLESLHGVWAPEHLFALGQALSVWVYQTPDRCDRQIERC
jgi:hypothetical protein